MGENDTKDFLHNYGVMGTLKLERSHMLAIRFFCLKL